MLRKPCIEMRNALADEWQHETDCPVSQDDSINLVHSKTLLLDDKYEINSIICRM